MGALAYLSTIHPSALVGCAPVEVLLRYRFPLRVVFKAGLPLGCVPVIGKAPDGRFKWGAWVAVGVGSTQPASNGS